MTKQHENWQQLSAMVDGELDSLQFEQTAKWVSEDKQALQKFARFAQISDVLAGHGKPCSADLTARIYAAIEDEPALSVPAAEQVSVVAKQAPSDVSSKNASSATPKNKVLRQHPSIYALAASVFLAVVLVYNPFTPRSSDTVSIATHKASEVNVASSENVHAASNRHSYNELKALLVAHGQFSSSSGLNGMATYSKLVSKDSAAVY